MKYGEVVGNFLLMLVNGIGLIEALVYIFVYYIYSLDRVNIMSIVPGVRVAKLSLCRSVE